MRRTVPRANTEPSQRVVGKPELERPGSPAVWISVLFARETVLPKHSDWAIRGARFRRHAQRAPGPPV